MRNFGALRETKEAGADFEIDVELYVPQGVGDEVPNIELQALVTVSTASAELAHSKPKLVKAGEPILELNVSPFLSSDLLGGPMTEEALDAIDEGYWVSLSRLMESGQCESSETDYYRRAFGMVIPSTTRSQVLVWWDQHGDELLARKRLAYEDGIDSVTNHDLDYWEFAREDGSPEEIARDWAESQLDFKAGLEDTITGLVNRTELSEKAVIAEFLNGFVAELATQIQLERERRPDSDEVRRRLDAAGIGATMQRAGGADWSVQAWGIGSRLLNLYLINTESETKDGQTLFELVYRDMEREANDLDYQIEPLAEGTLTEMIIQAPDVLKTLSKRVR